MCQACTSATALAAVKEVARSKIPTLGYGISYAIGNVLLALWGSVTVLLVAATRKREPGSTIYELRSIQASAAGRASAAKVRSCALTKWLAIFGAVVSNGLSETTAMRRIWRW